MIEFIKELLDLLFTFMKLALFNYGGGFALIPLIEHEILRTNWLSLEEFNQVIAISQITPGSIAINAATYIGYKVGGIIAALVASLAIPIPSFIIVILLSPFLLNNKDHPLYKTIFYCIRPVVVGLIINAAITVSRQPFLVRGTKLSLRELFHQLPNWLGQFQWLNIGSVAIFIISLVLVFKSKLNPIFILLIAGSLSLVLFEWVMPWVGQWM